MPDLIYCFDGGGRWVLGLAVTLVLCAVALWLFIDQDSPLWEDADEDDQPGRP